MDSLKHRCKTTAAALGRVAKIALVFVLAAAGDLLQELVVAAGLVLVTVALWPDVGVRALAVPGLVLVWMALPVRPSFIAKVGPVDPPKGNH